MIQKTTEDNLLIGKERKDINHYISNYETDIRILIISLLWINGFLFGGAVIKINNYRKYLKDQQDW